MLPLLLAGLLGISALVIVVAPLYAPALARRVSTEADGTLPANSSRGLELAEREALAKAALQDVEFDYQLGNLAEDDYQALRERYTRRVLAALKGRYDQERALDEAIEEQVRELKASASQAANGSAKASASPAAPKARKTAAARPPQAPAPEQPPAQNASRKSTMRSGNQRSREVNARSDKNASNTRSGKDTSREFNARSGRGRAR